MIQKLQHFIVVMFYSMKSSVSLLHNTVSTDAEYKGNFYTFESRVNFSSLRI